MRIFFFALSMLVFCLVGTAQAEERIISYDVNIRILPDSSIDVVENIVFYVEGRDIRLGFERDFPLSYYSGISKVSTPVDVISVKRNAFEENFWTEDIDGFKRLFVGAEYDSPENRLPVGLHSYEIKWSGLGHIQGFKDYDELYFNAIGTGWFFKIEQATGKVTLADGTELKQSAAYFGKQGENNPAIAQQLDERTIRFAAPRILEAEEGLTIAVGFTKGVLTPAVTQGVYARFLDSIIKLGSPYLVLKTVIVILAGFFTLLYYLVVWNRYGKDAPLGTIVPTYKAPENLSILKAAAMLGADSKTSFASSLVSLAAQGFISLQSNKITVQELYNEKKPALEEEAEIIKQINGKPISLNKYNSKFYNAFNDYTKRQNALSKKLNINNRTFCFLGILVFLASLYFLSFGTPLIGLYLIMMLLSAIYVPFLLFCLFIISNKSIVAGILTFLFVFAHGLASMSGVMVSVGNLSFIQLTVFMCVWFLLLAMHYFFAKIMNKPTPEGTQILTSLAGLRMFISATDENRYKLITPDIFEKNLPFAMLFGLEKKWVDEFQIIHPEYEPSWYDPSKGKFDRSMFHNLHNGISTTTSKPASRSSGGWSSGGGSFGGGSGGGGSSGGGSGGGGGRGR